MKYEVNALGKQCPIPVVMTKEVLDKAAAGDSAEVLVDNETAVNNLSRLAGNKGCTFVSEKLEEKKFLVKIGIAQDGPAVGAKENPKEEAECAEKIQKGLAAVIASDKMGDGDEQLGHILIKGFLYALSQLEKLPETVLFYNGGAKLTVEGSESLEDIKRMEEAGVEILTCGTCLKFYGIADKLQVGKVTDMYTITERMTGAEKLVRP